MEHLLLTLARASFSIGERRLERGEYDQAADGFRRVLAVMPDLDAGYAKLALALKGQRARRPLLDAYSRLTVLHTGLADSVWGARAAVLRDMLLDAYGPKVLGGPFAGMVFDGTVSEGCFLPRMLGCYEAELHPHLDALAMRRPELVINVGCAEGYYAVGLARRWPWVTVHAHDIDPEARDACRRLAEANGVADRVVVGERFDGPDFAAFAGRRVLVVCDVEGFEEELLDPARFPALSGFDVVAELHPFTRTDMAEEIARRFRPTHAVTLVKNRVPETAGLPAALLELSDADKALAVWETRGTPTPWAVMTANATSPLSG